MWRTQQLADASLRLTLQPAATDKPVRLLTPQLHIAAAPLFGRESNSGQFTCASPSRPTQAGPAIANSSNKKTAVRAPGVIYLVPVSGLLGG